MMVSPLVLVAMLCFFCLSRPVVGKVARGEFSIQKSGFHYFTKFGCSIGECPWEVRFRLVNPWTAVDGSVGGRSAVHDALKKAPPTSLELRLMLDETWEKAPINGRPKCLHMNMSRASRTVNIPLNGEWSEWEEGGLTQVVRPHVWFFVADDCNGVIGESIMNAVNDPSAHLGKLNFLWEFKMLQPNNSHFSYEQFGTFSVVILHTACYLSILIYLGIHETREMKRSGKIHVMLQMLNVCVLTQISSSLLHISHLLAYSFDGHGLTSLDSIAECLAVISQIVMSSVLILIGSGFSLNIPSAAQEVESTASPIIVVVTIVHVALVALDRFNADPRFKFHAADGFLGFVLILLRLILWGGFVLQCIRSISSHSTPHNVSAFLRRFLVAGSLYFLAYPFVFGITCVCPVYMQHKVLSNGIFLMQLSSMIWLCSLFLRKGEYFKISDLSQSYLPGGYLSSRGVYRLD